MPRARRLTLLLAAFALLAGCSTPKTGSDSLATGRDRVLGLVGDAVRTLPPTAHAATAPVAGTTPCRRTFLGYSVGETGKHHVEAPVLVKMDPGQSPRPLLDPIAAKWKSQGYTVDTSGLSDSRYPKITATTPDGYTVTATALLPSPQQLDLYAVSQCLAGS